MSGEFERWVKQNRVQYEACLRLIRAMKIVEREDLPQCEDCYAETPPHELTECPLCGTLACDLCFANYHGSKICDE